MLPLNRLLKSVEIYVILNTNENQRITRIIIILSTIARCSVIVYSNCF